MCRLIVDLQSGALDGLFRSCNRKLLEPVPAAGFLKIHVLVRVEILDLTRNLYIPFGCIK